MEDSGATQRTTEVGAPGQMFTSTFINSIWLRNRIVEMVRGRARDQRGASLVEYAFLLSFIVVVCVAAVTLLGSATSASATTSANSIVVAN
jgi:Flp pilus assembly pilin Flp